MKKEDITRLALWDAETETGENLSAAANLYDKLLQNHTQPVMVQDDITGTHLPNGMLLWFGFDFERAGPARHTAAQARRQSRFGSAPSPASP